MDFTSTINKYIFNLPENGFWVFVAVVEDDASPENTHAITTYIL